VKRVLILEPYYGGSHKSFLKGLQETVPAEFALLTLPARKWKMRMQLSAYWFVQEIMRYDVQQRFFDTVLCSTFVDVAALRSILSQIDDWNQSAKIITYFHENQFAYPSQKEAPDIRQFSALNMSTALASDLCIFNSGYNMESFLRAIQSFLKKASDMKPLNLVEVIRKKSIILYPGMDYSGIDRISVKFKKKKSDVPTIVWNHRWEHDKGPELLFEALYIIQEKGIPFHLIVLGQSFGFSPECFHEAAERLSEEIVHFSYAKSFSEYAELLCHGDVIVSTARHEFFGISIVEGVRAGCYPLLPNDLSYPELYQDEFLYEPGKLAGKLCNFLLQPVQLSCEDIQKLTEPFAWECCGKQYEECLLEP